MKRALIVGTGTVAGVAAVLALNPDGAATAVAGGRPSSASSSSTAGTSGTGSSHGSSAAGSQSATGTVVDVGRGYGSIQVQATLENGRIVDITALALPQNDGRSAMISQQAFPTLVQQALAAQSSQISGISGASYTSSGFAESLKAALLSVGHTA
jgi:uncharacterized protein with FMN-binding domain